MLWNAPPMKTSRISGFSRLKARLNGSRFRCSRQRVNWARVSWTKSPTGCRLLAEGAPGVMEKDLVEPRARVIDRAHIDAGGGGRIQDLRQRRVVAVDVDLEPRSVAQRLAHERQRRDRALEDREGI